METMIDTKKGMNMRRIEKERSRDGQREKQKRDRKK